MRLNQGGRDSGLGLVSGIGLVSGLGLGPGAPPETACGWCARRVTQTGSLLGGKGDLELGLLDRTAWDIGQDYRGGFHVGFCWAARAT